MHRHWRLLLLLACSVLADGQTAKPVPLTGSVLGVVVSNKDAPVPGATVFVAGTFLSHSTITEADGTFELDNVPAGETYLLAYKEAGGYPPNFAKFFSMPGEVFPTVSVTPNRRIEGVVIKLGAKTAYLDIEVFDDVGQGTEATAHFWRPDQSKGPDDWGIAETISARHKRFPVPPTPFGLTISAEGYEQWRYPGYDKEEEKAFILLNSGQTVKLSVHLRKAKSNN
jgi:hypothetical protein